MATFHELCYVTWEEYLEENSEGRVGQGKESLPITWAEELEGKGLVRV